jgi:oxygen-dependent protoporphyrinogen oxidase
MSRADSLAGRSIPFLPSSSRDGAHENPARSWDVIVLGGGISGLSCALELVSLGLEPRKIAVLEAQERLGGKIAAGEVGGISLDVGPDSFLNRRPLAKELIARVGLAEHLVAPGASGAQIVARGQLRLLPKGQVLGVPTSFRELMKSGILSDRGLSRAFLDWTMPRTGPFDPRRFLVPRARNQSVDTKEPDVAVGKVVQARMGQEVVDRLVDPLVGGINASRVANLSARVTFPGLLEVLAHDSPPSLARTLRASLRPGKEPPREQGGKDGPVAGPLGRKGPSQPRGGQSGPSQPGGGPQASPFSSLAGGLWRLVPALGQYLEELGVTVRSRARASSLRMRGQGGWEVEMDTDLSGSQGASSPLPRTLHAKALVVCLPAMEAARLLSGPARNDLAASRIRAILQDIEYSSVATVTWVLRDGPLFTNAQGTGFLVPAIEGYLTSAVTWLSRKWPSYLDVPETQALGQDVQLVRASTGKQGDERAFSMDDEELAAALLGELEVFLHKDLGDAEGIQLEVIDTYVKRWPNAFPQFEPGHPRKVSRLEQACEQLSNQHAPIALAGAYLDGVGIPTCMERARKAAARIMEFLKAAEASRGDGGPRGDGGLSGDGDSATLQHSR